MRWILLALTMLYPAFAADFVRGEQLSHSLSVCLDKADALAILEADSKLGRDAAEKVWIDKDRCQTVPVVDGPVVGNVVQSAEIERNGKKLTSRVIEIIGGGGASPRLLPHDRDLFRDRGQAWRGGDQARPEEPHQ